MNSSNKDWGKIIFRIAILLFIIFFISRWFAGGSREESSTDQTAPVQTVQIFEDTDPVAEESEPTESVQDSEDKDSTDLPDVAGEEPAASVRYEFRNRNLLDKHYDKHGIEMGFDSAEEYEAAASAVVNDPRALHKLEQEDGDDVFYIEDTHEFVIVSTDGFIRTYYYADKDYFDRQ